MHYAPTAASARHDALGRRLEEWVHAFLRGEGGNTAFSDGLKRKARIYHAPRLMALDLLVQCCGPEDGMPFQIPASGFYARMAAIAARYQGGQWDMPPLIVNQTGGQYIINDGNHRAEALKRLGIERFWVIVWETDGE